MTFNDRPISAPELVDIFVLDSLKNAVQIFGIEGTEDKIKELYVNHPSIQKVMMTVYNRTYKKG